MTWDGRVSPDIGSNLYIAGPWSADTAPPNGTTGVTFTITRAGYYRLEADVSGYTSSGGLQTWTTIYIDGVQVSQRTYLMNTALVHTNTGRQLWRQFLSAGTHYLFVRFSRQSDSNDNCLLTWDPIWYQ